MRIYKQEKMKVLDQIICNQCGREMKLIAGIVREGYLSHQETFGYFSRKDGEVHQFDLCESCYDRWIQGFAIPVEKTDKEVFVE